MNRGQQTNSFLPSVLWFYSALYAYTANPTAKAIVVGNERKTIREDE